MDMLELMDAVEANLPDAAPKLAYADWLDENDFPSRAAFVRWLGRTGRYPGRHSATGRICFYVWDESLQYSHLRPHLLPREWTATNQLFRLRQAGGSLEYDWAGVGNDRVNSYRFLSWLDLEQACASLWLELTRPRQPALVRRLFGAETYTLWTPDYTPIPAFDRDSLRRQQFMSGVR